MSDYKSSVILVYHNCVGTIQRCLKSLIKHSSKNTEIICVNNGSDDGSLNIVLSYEAEYSNIKLINIPQKTEYSVAKNIGLNLASGEYVYFTDGTDEIQVDISDLIYSRSLSLPDTVNNKLYKRIFLENNDDINQIIENKINEKLSFIDDKLSRIYSSVDSKLEKFRQDTAENIQNKVYDLISRIEYSEKFINEKHKEYLYLIDSAIKDAYLNKQEDNKYLYDEISKIYDAVHQVYDYINEEISKKNAEINKIFDEITKNYSYTECLVDEKNEYVQAQLKEQFEFCKKLKYDTDNTYENFKELFNLKINTILSSKFNLSEVIFEENNSVKALSDNLEKLYEMFNSSSESIYKEISSLYSDVTDKLNKQREEDNWLLNKGLSELKDSLVSDINEKTASLKDEINALR